jgi:aromatic ring-opening dioxygenase LigB subunit
MNVFVELEGYTKESGVNDQTLPKFKCKIIAGGANNVLAEDRHGMALKELGILYAPDYVINAGGLMNVFVELEGYTKERAHKHTLKIYQNLKEVFAIAKKENIPITLVSEKTLNYGAVVPLVYLTAHLPQVAVLPVSISGLDAKTHLDFGYFLKEQIMNHGKRVAVIASGDLSQTLTPEAPAGFNPAGKQFDETIQQLLSNKNSAGMLQLSEEIIVQSANCGFKTFLILMGVLRSINCTYKSYCYEAPFGVGYLTANFVL